jgi:hypothetical protein
MTEGEVHVNMWLYDSRKQPMGFLNYEFNRRDRYNLTAERRRPTVDYKSINTASKTGDG